MTRHFGDDDPDNDQHLQLDALVANVYRGVLEREPDPGGYQNWIDFLRNGGSLEGFLRATLGSREFVDQFPRRLAERIDPDTHLPQAAKRLAIISDCQGDTLARSIQALTGARLPPHRFISWADMSDPRRLVEPVRNFARDHDCVLMQPHMAAEVLEHAPELQPRIQLFPSIRFSGFHPDMSYVYAGTRSREIVGPLGVDHSTIAFYGWRVGMSVRETLDFYRADVFDTLRFHDMWQVSVEALRDEGSRAGLPLDSLIATWTARGCFMHSYNHPKLPVIVDVARALLQRLDVETLPLDPVDFIHDLLGEGTGWPVYPEIAHKLGLTGSYLFKPPATGVTSRTPVQLIDLERFVTESFACYQQASSGELICEKPFSERYREVFGEPARRRGRMVTAAAYSHAAPRLRASHPYAGLPAERFWNSAVAGVQTGDVDPVSHPRHRLTPRTRIATAGSCFAQHIARALSERGCNHQISEPPPAGASAAEAIERQFGLYSARYGNLYTPRQLVQLIERAIGRFDPVEPAWQRPDGHWADPFRPEIEPAGFGSIEALLADRSRHLAAVRRLLETVEVFVFTLGLTEAWVSSVDGAVFPLAPGVVAGTYDPQRHRFINFDVAEVIADLENFVALLAELNPSARVLLTVSPVPLVATYEDGHVLTSTVRSKSVLRAAAESLRQRHPHCDYFPSYEIISSHFNRGRYYGPDLRSISRGGVEHVMRLFFKHYIPDAPEPQIDTELMEEVIAMQRLVCEEECLDQSSGG